MSFFKKRFSCCSAVYYTIESVEMRPVFNFHAYITALSIVVVVLGLDTCKRHEPRETSGIQAATLVVRHHAIRALAGMGQTRQRWAIDELVAVDIGDSRHLADAMCESFDRQCGIPADALTDDDLQKLVAKLELAVAVTSTCS